jgi:hypothetical protein
MMNGDTSRVVLLGEGCPEPLPFIAMFFAAIDITYRLRVLF